jgi:hypothetical protein
MPAVLAAGIVVASVRVTERASSAQQPESALLERTPYELRFINPDPNGNPFNVDAGGPGAPGYPTLPSDATANRKIAVKVPGAITAANRSAQQVDGDASSFHWALIIGINDYAGGTRDNIGSYQDAAALRQHLLNLGWRDDHIVMIANRSATKPNILEGLSWLQEKTDSRSTAVFHYSGHEKPFKRNADRDRERRDVGLWVSDNNLISDGELGAAMGGVRASRMWINMAVCRAGGFNDAGTMRAGRVITFSSPEAELSYEDPNVKHSVMGWNMIMRGMRKAEADANGDGKVTVEEAFHFARPLVVARTEGHQHPVIEDGYNGEFDLTIQNTY